MEIELKRTNIIRNWDELVDSVDNYFKKHPKELVVRTMWDEYRKELKVMEKKLKEEGVVFL